MTDNSHSSIPLSSSLRDVDDDSDCSSAELIIIENCDLESVDDEDFDWDGAINARYGKEEEVKVVSKSKSKAKRRGNVLGPDEKPTKASQLTIEQKIRIFQENRRFRRWSPAPKMFTIQEVDWSSDSEDDAEEVVEPARKKRDSSPRPVNPLSSIVDHSTPPRSARPAALPLPLSPSSSSAPSPSSSQAAPLSPSSTYGSYSPSSSSAPLSPSSAAPFSPSSAFAPPSPSSISCPPSPSSAAPVSPTSPLSSSPPFFEAPRTKKAPPPPPPPLSTSLPSASEKADLSLPKSPSSKGPSTPSARKLVAKGMGQTEEIPHQTLRNDSDESAVLATLRDLILQKQKALGEAPAADPPTESDASLQNSALLDKLAALQLIMRKRTREQEEEHKLQL